MNAALPAIQAATRAGWFYWLGDWYTTDLAAVLHLEAPPRWTGTARDLCLAQGLEFAEARP
jgi:hypothetical protein